MKIAGTQFSFVNGQFEIFLSGCSAPHCEGCHNPELWDFDRGQYWEDKLESIRRTLTDNPLIDSVLVVGGEPLDQHHGFFVEFTAILCGLCRKLGITTYLFTRYELEDVPRYFQMQYDRIKTGKYDKELTDNQRTVNGIKLASTNQKLLYRGVDYYIESIPLESEGREYYDRQSST